jgi:peptidoglycan-associated lipoprotein
MQKRGLRHIAVGAVLCLGLGLVGCSHNKHKGPGASTEYGASTQGIGEGSEFSGESPTQDLLAKRKIYFEFDRSDINDNDFEIIQAHAGYLKEHPNSHVRIEGHTDEQGSREYNIGLGERRARTVANALVSQGVSGQQISTVSFGKEKPDVEAHGEEAYRLNRRAVIVYEDR